MDHIEIEGYKSIRHAKVEFTPVNILIGANGAGKSNFIRFFEFLNQLYQQKLREYVGLNGGVDRMLFQGRKQTPKLKCRISFDNAKNEYSFELGAGESEFVFAAEGLWYEGNEKDISNFGTESRLKLSGQRRGEYIEKHLEGFKLYHFHDTGKSSPFNRESRIDTDRFFLYEKGENLAAFLFGIKEQHPKIYQRIVRMIQSIAPFFSDFHFQPNSNGYVRLLWTDKYGSMLYGPNDFSDGTMRFIALATLFLQPSLPSSLIIDEPELGLHPTAIVKLAGMIQSAAAKGCKVIVSTQSTDLVSCFEAENIITVDLIEGESKFKRLESKELSEWLNDYALGELWKRNIIAGGQPWNV